MNATLGSFAAIGCGAAIGAWLRWGLLLWLNHRHPLLPYGTLAANLIGGYLVGVAVAYFGNHPELSPAWRLFAVTGFLGGLTTFSTYSAEVVELLLRGEPGWALATAGAHLLGSLVLTAAGIATFRVLSA